MSWIPPIGIPAPNWGGTVGNPIDAVRPDPPSPWTTNITDVYYVESGGTNPSFGYPGNPCGEIPRILPAGTQVFVNGIYTKVHSPAYLHPNGTNTNPVWITSYDMEDKATCTGHWEFIYDATYHCNHLIVDGLNWDTGGGAVTIGGSAHHICIRNGSTRGPGKISPETDYDSPDGAFNQTAIGISSSGSLTVAPTEQIVLSNMNLTRGGNWQYSTGDPDAHGVGLAPMCKDIWIVDCEMSYFSGCAIQVGTGSTDSNTDAQAALRVYIGRCTAHHIAQTAFFAKRVVVCIMSQNTVHTVRRDTPSSPNGGGFGGQYGQAEFWIIYNTVYNCQSGIGFGGGSEFETDIYIIGNVIYDIHDEYWFEEAWRGDPDDGAGTAILLRCNPNHHIINNTIHDYDAGIQCPVIANNRFIEGNIFSGRNGSVDGLDINCSYDGSGNNTVKTNIIEQIGGAIWANLAANTYTTVAGLNAVGGNKSGNIATAPTYESAGTGDFRLASGSAGIDAFGSAANAAYATFLTNYGIDIRRDRSGGERPWTGDEETGEAGGNWDIGAYEFGAAIPPPPPPAATFSPARHITPSTPGDP